MGNTKLFEKRKKETGKEKWKRDRVATCSQESEWEKAFEERKKK
jgi:hypothetical protein